MSVFLTSNVDFRESVDLKQMKIEQMTGFVMSYLSEK